MKNEPERFDISYWSRISSDNAYKFALKYFREVIEKQHLGYMRNIPPPSKKKK